MRKMIRPTKLRKEKFDGMSESRLWEIRKEDKTFPKPVPLGGRAIAFYEDEIDAWAESQRSKVTCITSPRPKTPPPAVGAQRNAPSLPAMPWANSK